MGCTFCGIAGHTIDAMNVYEDERVIAFRDIHPKAPLHVLVMPKEHIQSVADLKEDQADIVAKLIFAAQYVAARNDLKGYKLVFNVGRDGGQTVDHLHMHVLGGWEKPEDRRKGFMDEE